MKFTDSPSPAAGRDASPRNFWRRSALGAALCLLAAPAALFAQQNAIVGSLTNFDAANYEGHDAYGMEIEIEGVQPTEFSQAWTNRYGNPSYSPSPTGTYVRYQAAWSGATQSYSARTNPKTPGTGFQGSCYSPLPFNTAGCDHFGPRPTNYNYRVLSYRWMFPDPANPSQLVAGSNNIFVPTPVYYWAPAPVVGDPPELVAEIVVPPPPPAPIPQYGDANWMKVYESEVNRHVTLEELVDTNAIVPQDPAEIETDWELVQASPPGETSGHRQRGKHFNQRAPKAGTRAVIRRYETYTYTGAYDPVTHEALCGGDTSCDAPLDGELGDMLIAQMAAANIAVPSLTIATVGSGKVTSSDKVLACGSKCVANYPLDAVVTLTAEPASKYTFGGWTGACAGLATTCNVTIADEMNVTATFNPVVKAGGGGGGGGSATLFLLSVSKSNTGTVTATPAGTNDTINCGSVCKAKFTSGAVVTVTAKAAAGKIFTGWTGACAGTAPTCKLTMSKDQSAAAGFSK
ncbi:MAG: InlB B-repeat-containing protein [Panacagrimonas sp.]